MYCPRFISYLAKLAESHFGLAEDKFKELRNMVQKIYYLGSKASLLKTYTGLKPINLPSTRDILVLPAQDFFYQHPPTFHLECPLSAVMVNYNTLPRLHHRDRDQCEQLFPHRYGRDRLLQVPLGDQEADDQSRRAGFSICIYRPLAVTSTATNVPARRQFRPPHGAGYDWNLTDSLHRPSISSLRYRFHPHQPTCVDHLLCFLPQPTPHRV